MRTVKGHEMYKKILKLKFIFATSIFMMSSAIISSQADAVANPTLKWKIDSLTPSTTYSTLSLASINSTASRTWSASGNCALKNGKLTTKASGYCIVKLKLKANKKFLGKNYSKKFLILKAFSTTTSTTSPRLLNRYTTRSVADGLGDNLVYDVFAIGTTVYAATRGGLSISTNGGTSFVNRSRANGLANPVVRSVYVVGLNVYAGTDGGLSVSTDGGNTFTTRIDSNNWNRPVYFHGIFAVGSNVFVGTSDSGLQISSDNGLTFTERNALNQLPGGVFGIYASGNTIYAATNFGLSISTDGGNSFVTRTSSSGIGDNFVYDVHVVDQYVYVATPKGLSISTDGGSRFTNLILNTGNFANVTTVRAVYTVGTKVFAATDVGLSISN